MPKPKTGHKLLNVRVSSEAHARLLAESAREEESVSTLIRAALRVWFLNEDLPVEPEDRLPQ